MECSIEIFRVAREAIAYLKFILEGYQGLAVLKTLDARQGLVSVHIAPGAEKDIALILDDLAGEIPLSRVDEMVRHGASGFTNGNESDPF
jgi:hypothetical protein